MKYINIAYNNHFIDIPNDTFFINERINADYICTVIKFRASTKDTIIKIFENKKGIIDFRTKFIKYLNDNKHRIIINNTHDLFFHFRYFYMCLFEIFK